MTNVGRNRQMLCGKSKPRALNIAMVMDRTGIFTHFRSQIKSEVSSELAHFAARKDELDA